MTPEILVQTVPVGPRQTALKEQWFAVIVAAMWQGEAPPPGGWGDLDQMLLPWRWTPAHASPYKWSTTTPIGARARLTGNPDWVDLTVTMAPTESARSPALAISSTDVEAWIQTPVHTYYTVKRGAKRAGKELLDRQVIALATSWGAIPEMLRLLHYCRIALPEGHTDDNVEKLTFFPQFELEIPPTTLPDSETDWKYLDGAQREVATLRAAVLSVTVPSDKKTPITFDGEPVGGPQRELDFGSYWFKAEPLPAPPPGFDELHSVMDDTKLPAREEKSIPQALSLRVLDAAHAVETQGADPWTKVAGVGLLLRRGNDAAQPWLCMNGARLTTPNALDVLRGPHLAPLPLLLRGRTDKQGQDVFERDLLVEYAQAPLFAEHLLPTAPEHVGKVHEGSTIDGEELAPGTKYERSYVLKQNVRVDGDNEGNRLLLHRLVYGTTYDAAVFLADIGGGLPRELAGDLPWVLTAEAFAPNASAICTGIPYLRRVGIGHAEIVPALPISLRQAHPSKIPAAAACWPAVPEGVQPLYFAIGGQASTASTADATLGGRAPIILPSDGTFDFEVRPPATSREVCERWAQDGVALRAVLNDAAAQGEDDIPSLDDPATDCLVLEVEEGSLVTKPGIPEEPPTREWVWASRSVALIAHAPVNGRSPFVRMQLTVGANYNIHGSRITVPSPSDVSRIVRVSVYVALRDGAKERFEVYVPMNGKPPQAYLNEWTTMKAGKAVLPPERFVVELASTSLPTIDALRTAFAVRKAGRTLTLMLMPDAASAAQARAFAALDRVEIDRLEWIYQGVPRPRPATAGAVWPPKIPDDALRAWELESLRDISAVDIMTIPTVEVEHRNLFDGRASRIAIDDYEKDLSGRYMKYRLRAFSRYAGLAKDYPAYLSHQRPLETAPGAPNEANAAGWARAYVAYEGPPPVRPSILATIPLTDSPMKGRGDLPCPLLLVLDQPPFTGGIDEEITCEVLQYGRDPILSADSVDPEFEALTLEVEGPYGHSRDTDAQRPLYTLGSYIVYPPKLTSAAAWDMAQLRFRRTHQSLGKADEAARSSEWTDPRWVQFLPQRSFGGDLAAIFDEARRVLTVALTFSAAPEPEVHFEYLFLVTQRIVDYRGRNDMEEIVDIVPASRQPGDPVTFVHEFDAPLPQRQYSVRLCEVQLATDETLPRDIRASLLDGSKDAKDAGFRLTRISPAIEVAVTT